VRLILALAALENWHISGLDVRNAYLYGDLDEEIYMEQPDGFVQPGKEKHVLKLLKALYGLKQAGRVWWQTLHKFLTKSMGFTRLQSDAGVFVYRAKDGGLVILIVYVDDALFLGPDLALVHKVKAIFAKKWECRDLGEATDFLRMRITRKGQSIVLDQQSYLEKVLERFQMTNAKSA
jgi:hypothetical protein